ncbi:MAG: ribonuclease P protein component [Nitrosomonadales bacterium]|nr:ribonuclease P protein component [Nitrosomonadales bacterium]
MAFRAQSITNKWFAIYVRRNEHNFARLGIAASKRILPKAIYRNRAKRLIRDIFRCNFPPEQAVDIVVRPKRQINPKDAVEGRKALKQLFLQAVQA